MPGRFTLEINFNIAHHVAAIFMGGNRHGATIVMGRFFATTAFA
jgi:hypothetical protein